ncbi:MAG: hypothetical protein ACRELB_04660, partial [Polyangiaceae bacterium]
GSPVCPAAQCGFSCDAGYHLGGASCNADCLPNSDDPSTDPCVVADGLGVFVAPTGNDSNDGSKEHPFGSIAHAMSTNARVYACGTFTAEQLTVTGNTMDGTTVYGGFDCASWTYSASTPTKLAPTAAGFALTVNGLTKGVTFEDFEFDAIAAPSSVPASGAGVSSQTVIVNGSAGVVFRRVVINAGTGQPGAQGSSGVNGWSGNATGGNAASGTTAGGAISCACGSTGGQGGAPGTFNNDTLVFAAGTNGGDGTQTGIANHGVASSSPTSHCSAGDWNGVTTGGPGSPGVGASGAGLLGYPAGWTNAAIGGAGGLASVGEGGGGGGGFYYTVGTGGGTPNGAGGGGGCGGCGGAGGNGGTAGGSSIALLMIGSAVTLDASTLNAASGGTGGLGGPGLSGQLGGGPGSGSGNNSCAGGAGAQGGLGGAGGGGVGGASIAVAYSGAAPTHVGTVTETVAPAASGGTPTSGNSNAGTTGADGASVKEQAF